MIDVAQRERDRIMALFVIYHAVNGISGALFFDAEIRKTLGWDRQRFKVVMRWLKDHKFIASVVPFTQCVLTVTGADKAEIAITNTPARGIEQPTDDYRPGIYL
jgi:hypothetical protein